MVKVCAWTGMGRKEMMSSSDVVVMREWSGAYGDVA
jgi:hypothetical protein